MPPNILPTIDTIEIHADVAASVLIPIYHSALSHIPFVSRLTTLRLYKLRIMESQLVKAIICTNAVRLQSFTLSFGEDEFRE